VTSPLLTPWLSGLESGAVAAGLANESNNSNTGQYSVSRDFGSLSIGSGVCTLSHTSGNTQFAKTGSDLASGKFMISCDFTARSVTGSPGFLNSGVGIVKDFNNVLFADYDHVINHCRIAYAIGGVFHFGTGVTRALTPPYSLALVCDGGKLAQMWAKTGLVWEFLSSHDLSADFPWGSFTFTGWKPGFGCSCPNQSSWSFDNLRAAQRYR
jgi:hypothetical protein